MIKFQNIYVTKVNGQRHIQTFFNISSLMQKHDITSYVGLPVAL